MMYRRSYGHLSQHRALAKRVEAPPSAEALAESSSPTLEVLVHRRQLPPEVPRSAARDRRGARRRSPSPATAPGACSPRRPRTGAARSWRIRSHRRRQAQQHVLDVLRRDLAPEKATDESCDPSGTSPAARHRVPSPSVEARDRENGLQLATVRTTPRSWMLYRIRGLTFSNRLSVNSRLRSASLSTNSSRAGRTGRSSAVLRLRRCRGEADRPTRSPRATPR